MTLTCPLCSYAFERTEMRAGGCRMCPSDPGGCGLVRCPACDYEWPPEESSGLVRVIRRLFGPARAKEES